jgi:putative toxin-antitoxin system antitoxin component (TIGR02293 family)
MSKTSIKSRVSRGSKRTTAARRSAVRRPVVVRYVVRFLLGNGLGRSGASAELLAQLRRGLPVSEVEELRAAMALRREELAPLLGISKATLHRRWAAGRFGAAESDRVARYARLFGLATVGLESTELARGWLGSPQRGLGGAVPLQFAESELGAREVEDLLLRSEHGVYS